MYTISLHDEKLQKLSHLLKDYHLKTTVSTCAALMTIPTLISNAPRIELLIHLAIINCKGKRRPSLADLSRWLNRNLDKSNAKLLEDPPEDVFIGNIASIAGNFRIFQGFSPNNEHYTQRVLNAAIEASESLPLLSEAVDSCLSLLKLSDAICQRLNLSKWHYANSSHQTNITVAPALGIPTRADALTFDICDLNKVGIQFEKLKPFILDLSTQNSWLHLESTSDSPIRRHPLTNFQNQLILTNPHATAFAIRSFLCACIRDAGLANIFDEIETSKIVSNLLDNFLKVDENIVHHPEAMGFFQEHTHSL